MALGWKVFLPLALLNLVATGSSFVVIVKRKHLSIAERLYLPEVFRGLSITFRKMFVKRSTRQYPEERCRRRP